MSKESRYDIRKIRPPKLEKVSDQGAVPQAEQPGVPPRSGIRVVRLRPTYGPALLRPLTDAEVEALKVTAEARKATRRMVEAAGGNAQYIEDTRGVRKEVTGRLPDVKTDK